MSYTDYILNESDDVAKALKFAKEAHKGQTDKNGVDYITHPVRVMKSLKNKNEKIIALLHDTVEDTNITYDDIKNEFGDHIAKVVGLLTHEKGEDYEKYIKRISNNKSAKNVKLADLKDNMDEKRLNKLPPKLKEKLLKKYNNALSLLGESKQVQEFKDYILEKDQNYQQFALNYIFDNEVSEALKIYKGDVKQPWHQISNAKSTEEIDKVYDGVLKYAKEAQSEFKRMLKKVAKVNTRVLIDTKSLSSFKDKVINRGRDSSEIHDVLRGALLFDNKEEVEQAVNTIKKKFKLHSYEEKKFQKDKEFGYFGSHHFGIVMNNGMIVELQVMTKKLWTHKSIAHDIYNKFRSVKKVNMSKELEAEMDKEKRRSKAVFSKGNR